MVKTLIISYLNAFDRNNFKTALHLTIFLHVIKIAAIIIARHYYHVQQIPCKDNDFIYNSAFFIS